ncbi:MAG: hypothetical protein ACYDH5_04410 [Acidimicrobiales bacterium]
MNDPQDRRPSLEKGQHGPEREWDEVLTRFWHLLGGPVEEDAKDVIEYVLASKGFEILDGPTVVTKSAGHEIARCELVDEEMAVVLRANDPAGNAVSVIVEPKVRLAPLQVESFARELPGLVSILGMQDPYLPYVYGLRVYSGVNEAASRLGIGVINPDGERVAPRHRVTRSNLA